MKESMHSSLNDTEWTNESRIQLIQESVDQWNKKSAYIISQIISKSMNQWITESMNQWTTDSTIQWSNAMNQRFNGSVSQWNNESTNQWFNEPVVQQFSAPLGQWINETTHMNDWLTDWLTEWMDGWTNESRNQWIIASMNQTANKPMNYANPFPDPNSFLGFEVETELSPYSLVRILPTSSSKSAPSMPIFWFFCEARPQHGLIFQVLWACHFVYDFYVKSSSRYSLVHILPTSSPKSAPIPADPLIFCTLFISLILLWRPHPKKHRVSRPRLFSPVNSHASELLHFPW